MSNIDKEGVEPALESDDRESHQPDQPVNLSDKSDRSVKRRLKIGFPPALVAFLRNEKFLIAFVLLLAIVTRFYNFGEPKQIVLDEVYFPKYVTEYFKGEYFFDIHPPLAKLMMAGWAGVLGAKAPVDFDFKKIGKHYPSNFYKYIRFLVCLFGVLLPLVVYLLTRELFSSRWPAFLAALFVVFDNAILTQSRYILIDVFLLVFGVSGLWFLLLARKKPHGSKAWLWFMGLSAAALSACCSVKWTGATFLGLAGIVLLYDWFNTRKLSRFLYQAGMLLGIGFFLYFTFFAIHFKLLYKSGVGDAFMSTSFKATLEGARLRDPNVKPAGLFDKFTELNRVMMSANASITQTHSYSSKWYTWPLMLRPMYYWVSSDSGGRSSRIYLLGNPIIWWMAFLVFIYWTGWSVWKLATKQSDPHLAPILLLLIGYLCNMLAYIMVSRVAFIYHYLPSLLMMMMGMGLFFYRNLKKHWQVTAVIMVVVMVMFVYFSPLSYGLPLTGQAYQGRLWMPSWL